MKIAIVVETFAKEMGYINNTLPKYLYRLGHEVTLITSDKSPYYSSGSAKVIFGEDFSLKNKLESGSEFQHNGFSVIVLHSSSFLGKLRIHNLHNTLKKIKPDIIYTFQVTGWLAIQCSVYSIFSSSKLMSGNHTGLSSTDKKKLNPINTLKSFVLKKLPGYFISFASFRCIVPTIDCGEVAESILGIKKSKIKLLHLPVDADYFFKSHEKDNFLRHKLQIPQDELICIFTGKLSHDKNPLIIANAITKLRQKNIKIQAVFVGEGEQKKELQSFKYSHILPFVPVPELGRYFRSCDIGIWTSESISYLDAACSGLPLILSSFIKDVEHLKEFTEIYEDNNINSLCSSLSKLVDDDYRNSISNKAYEIGRERFSAAAHVKKRLKFSDEEKS
tara:strand:- start:4706 stop:5875 length:1170 start_codon:yes stop_codon:yes gene_type:complete